MTPMLVTGGAGFIGSAFVRRQAAAGRAVVVLDKLTFVARPERVRNLPGVDLVEGDVADRPLLKGLFERHGFGTVVHFAAESHVDTSITTPAPFLHTNVEGTFALLEAARRAWSPRAEGMADCRFLQVGTDEVFGDLGDGEAWADEDSPYRPSSPYSASKAAADHFLKAYHRTFGLPVLLSHGTNTYGPGQHPEKLIPKAVERLARNEAVPVYGDGLQVRDWIHVEDHCAALEAILERGRPGRAYAVGAENPRTNRELLARIADLVDARLGRAPGAGRALLQPAEDRPGHDRRYAMRTARIREELGWRPGVDFGSGLSGTVEAMLAELRPSA